jgi:hypothetical protein
MRTSPLLGSKAWFGPRRFGWGLGPVSVEGWAVTAIFVAVGAVIRRRRPDMQAAAKPVLATLAVVIAVVKGTTPGGRRAWRKFDAARQTTRD